MDNLLLKELLSEIKDLKKDIKILKNMAQMGHIFAKTALKEPPKDSFKALPTSEKDLEDWKKELRQIKQNFGVK